MGRNRKPAKSITTAAPEVTSVATPEPTTQTTSGVAGQPDWFPYRNTRYFNAAMLPPELQEMIKGGGQQVYNKFMQQTENVKQTQKAQFLRDYGLDLENPKDAQIWADFMSVFNPENGVYANRFSRVGQSEIVMENYSFEANESPEGTGYSMVARQVAAAQEIAKRTGKKVIITVSAVQGEEYNGAATWPKLGYHFGIPYEWQRELVRNYGFEEEYVVNGTSRFMDKRNRYGQLGWDVWRDLVESMPWAELQGTTEVFPDGRESDAMKITRLYGKRKGYNKALRQPVDSLFSPQGPSAEDDATLKQIWMEMKHGS